MRMASLDCKSSRSLWEIVFSHKESTFGEFTLGERRVLHSPGDCKCWHSLKAPKYIWVVVGTCILYLRPADATRRHVPPEKLVGSAPSRSALLVSWFKAASYTTSQSRDLLEKPLSGGH